MSKFAMLQLGAVAQKLFNMQDGFDIEVIETGPEGGVLAHRFYNRKALENSYPGRAVVLYDDVPFQKIGNDSERFWVAYSERFNTLAIKEINENKNG